MITDIRDTIFERHEIRKSKQQKTAFIEYIESVCRENDIPVTTEKIGNNRNIVMGASAEESNMVLTAHYDTCSVMPFPNIVTPKNFPVYFVYQVVISLLLLLPGIIAAIILPHLGLYEYAMPVFGVCSLIVLLFLKCGPANKHTANDNTSGVITVLNIMLSMTPEQRKKVCFILFDNEESGLKGSKAFAGKHKDVKKTKPVINLDCVSDGDYLYIKMPKKDKKTALCDNLRTALQSAADSFGMTVEFGTGGFYPSDQASFKRGIAVAAFNKSKLIGLYLSKIHTKHDTVFNERNIECITAGMLELIGGHSK